jgi:peptide/nickel transport system substrate-binding protein
MARLHPYFRTLMRLTAPAAMAMLAGCRSDPTRAAVRGGDGTVSDGGTLIIALQVDISTFLPPYAIATQDKMAAGLLFDRLAEPGDSLNTFGDRGFVPRLAERWDWTHDSLAIVFHLNPRAKWQDGVPVRANDVVFTFQLYTNPAAGVETASELTAIDSVTATDSLTAVFWFKHRYPEQFFDATYQMLICPAHLLRGIPVTQLRTADFAHHPVGDGRFRFGGATPGSTVEFVADTGSYRGRARLDRVIVAVTPSPGAALTRVLSGDADFFDAVPPANVPEVERDSALVTLMHDEPSYGFLWFNLRTGTPPHPHPIFGERAVRQALAMALDRAAIVRNVWDSLAFVADGPFARGTSSADPQAVALPYDTARANRLLDSAGWRRGPDGVRQRAGRPLAFSLSMPTSSKPRQQVALLIQDQLSRVGARVTVDPTEMGTFVSQLRTHNFDAVIMVWVTDGAMSDLRESWMTPAVRDGANFGSYESPAFDGLLDSALSARNSAQTHALLHRAYAQINEDVPAVWLYQPRDIIVVHRRVHTAFLRPDAWYAHLADWYIPPESRLPRDNIGLAAMPR